MKGSPRPRRRRWFAAVAFLSAGLSIAPAAAAAPATLVLLPGVGGIEAPNPAHSEGTGRQGVAIVGGYALMGTLRVSNADATLQYWNGTGWVDHYRTVADASGHYSAQVSAGFSYRYFVSAVISIPITISNLGTFPCEQTWTGFSHAVTASAGLTYDNLNAVLQSNSGSGCAYPRPSSPG